MKRAEMRELAFKTIYSKFFNPEEDENELFENVDSESLAFIDKILANFNEHSQEINNKIVSKLKGYTIERLFKIDLSILILAVIELDYIKENPKQIVINECVELAKKYSTEKSPKFINGVLADMYN